MDYEIFRRATSALLARQHALREETRTLQTLSEASLSRGELERLGERLRRQLDTDGRNASHWHALGNVEQQLGCDDAALAAWTQALRQAGDDVDRMVRIGGAIARAGGNPAAIAESVWPDAGNKAAEATSPTRWTELSKSTWIGLLSGDFSAALPELRRAYRHSNGNQRHAEALIAALEAAGENSEAACLRARGWLIQGKVDQALQTLEAEAAHGRLCQPFLGDHLHALRRAGRHGQLVEFAEAAGDALIASDYEEWASSLLDRGELDAARDVLKSAATRLHDARLRAKHRLLLPAVCASKQDVERALQLLASGIADLDEETAGANLAASGTYAVDCPEPLFHLGYHADDVASVLKDFGRIASRFGQSATSIAQEQRASSGPSSREHRIRVGYASSHLNFHTVSRYFAGWLQHADRKHFEVQLFPLDSEPDWMTDYLSRHVDVMHPRMATDTEASMQIRQAGLDVLVYLDVGMESLSIQLAAQRLAAVQCVAWGHPLTTGIANVDYFISADGMDTVSDAVQYSERLLLLPGIGACIPAARPPTLRPSRAQFGLSTSDVVMLSPQSLFKYRPSDDWAFAAVVERVPDAVLVFFEGEYPAWTTTFIARLRREFSTADVDFDAHVRVLPRQTFDTFLGINLFSDVCLDSWGWSGGMTSLDALACGLPLVTLAGSTLRGRQSAAMLNQLGVTETIARDPMEFVQIATRLGTDLDWRNRVRSRIQANHHCLFGDRAGLVGLEAFYRWVVGTPQSGDEQRFKLGPAVA
ncbi:MAG: tetratricopeptide repeat protein [Pseudomarimonas sp.]